VITVQPFNSDESSSPIIDGQAFCSGIWKLRIRSAVVAELKVIRSKTKITKKGAPAAVLDLLNEDVERVAAIAAIDKECSRQWLCFVVVAYHNTVWLEHVLHDAALALPFPSHTKCSVVIGPDHSRFPRDSVKCIRKAALVSSPISNPPAGKNLVISVHLRVRTPLDDQHGLDVFEIRASYEFPPEDTRSDQTAAAVSQTARSFTPPRSAISTDLVPPLTSPSLQRTQSALGTPKK
jgi:hypothetical protein